MTRWEKRKMQEGETSKKVARLQEISELRDKMIRREGRRRLADLEEKRTEKIVERMCQHYCKWPVIWDEKREGCELQNSNVCANCPMNEL